MATIDASIDELTVDTAEIQQITKENQEEMVEINSMQSNVNEHGQQHFFGISTETVLGGSRTVDITSISVTKEVPSYVPCEHTETTYQFETQKEREVSLSAESESFDDLSAEPHGIKPSSEIIESQEVNKTPVQILDKPSKGVHVTPLTLEGASVGLESEDTSDYFESPCVPVFDSVKSSFVDVSEAHPEEETVLAKVSLSEQYIKFQEAKEPVGVLKVEVCDVLQATHDISVSADTKPVPNICVKTHDNRDQIELVEQSIVSGVQPIEIESTKPLVLADSNTHTEQTNVLGTVWSGAKGLTSAVVQIVKSTAEMMTADDLDSPLEEEENIPTVEEQKLEMVQRTAQCEDLPKSNYETVDVFCPVDTKGRHQESYEKKEDAFHHDSTGLPTVDLSASQSNEIVALEKFPLIEQVTEQICKGQEAKEIQTEVSAEGIPGQTENVISVETEETTVKMVLKLQEIHTETQEDLFQSATTNQFSTDSSADRAIGLSTESKVSEKVWKDDVLDNVEMSSEVHNAPQSHDKTFSPQEAKAVIIKLKTKLQEISIENQVYAEAGQTDSTKSSGNLLGDHNVEVSLSREDLEAHGLQKPGIVSTESRTDTEQTSVLDMKIWSKAKDTTSAAVQLGKATAGKIMGGHLHESIMDDVDMSEIETYETKQAQQSSDETQEHVFQIGSTKPPPTDLLVALPEDTKTTPETSIPEQKNIEKLQNQKMHVQQTVSKGSIHDTPQTSGTSETSIRISAEVQLISTENQMHGGHNDPSEDQVLPEPDICIEDVHDESELLYAEPHCVDTSSELRIDSEQIGVLGTMWSKAKDITRAVVQQGKTAASMITADDLNDPLMADENTSFLTDEEQILEKNKQYLECEELPDSKDMAETDDLSKLTKSPYEDSLTSGLVDNKLSTETGQENTFQSPIGSAEVHDVPLTLEETSTVSQAKLSSREISTQIQSAVIDLKELKDVDSSINNEPGACQYLDETSTLEKIQRDDKSVRSPSDHRIPHEGQTDKHLTNTAAGKEEQELVKVDLQNIQPTTATKGEVKLQGLESQEVRPNLRK
ncbi:uncharacterized protein LOC112486982 [Cynoglossus semilaevis]|uniref:uncharacterized protein LOC112486982 n=1 Tax=Cynoglossus semilaevis TaxID=244447 RepID=UPI000D62A90B|nr:uncharacterized protein LOC112486982 [Cynoglossus semilaevis]